MKHTYILIYFILLFTVSSRAGNIMWASKVISYSSQLDTKSYAAKQALGSPSRLPTFGDCGCAWSPSMAENYYDEYIRVGFEKRIRVSEIIISENFNAGAIKAIYLFDQYNIAHLVYQRAEDQAKWVLGRVFTITIPTTDFATNDLKLVLDTESIDGYNQIDAIGIAEEQAQVPTGSVNSTGKIVFKGKAQNLGARVNTYGSDISPMTTPDGNTLYFTRKNHMGNMGTIMNDDVWVTTYDGIGWSEAENIGSPINNSANNYVVGISENGNMVTLANQYSLSGESRIGIAQSWKKSGSWTFPINLVTPGMMTHNLYAEYFMNSDRTVLCLALERADSYGMKDIYVSFSDDQINWSDPMNVGDDINTSSNEMAPFLSPDGKMLFFSSNGLPGFGDEDIYFSIKLDDTWKHWSIPENLGSLVNSKGFDAYFTYPDTANYAYFSSTGDRNLNADIYRIPLKEIVEITDSLITELQKKEIPENTDVMVNDESNPEEPSFEEEVVIPEKEELNIELSNDLLLFGTVFDANTDIPINANLTFSLTSFQGDPIVLNTLNNNYRVKITDSLDYKVSIIREGYLPYEAKIKVEDFRTQKVKRIDFKLIPLAKGEKIILNNLYFEANRAVIDPQSFEELDRLYDFLVFNPGSKIEIGGHTNGLCSESYCEKLSLSRANAVRTYLINKGINQLRITTVGYGSKKPIDTNSTVEGRKKNQRVEITFQ